MKKRSFVCILAALGILSTVSIQHPARAASPFVSNIRTQVSGNNYLQIMWDSAKETGASATVVYEKTGDATTRVSQTVASPGVVSWFATVGAGNLTDDTSYTISIEYANGTTNDGTPLSTYSDFSTSSSKIISSSYVTRTRKDAAIFTASNLSYVLPGETVRLYGQSLGTGPTSLTGKTAKLAGGGYIERVVSATGLYEFPIVAWSDTYIDLTVPTYDANKTAQSGALYFDDLAVGAAKYHLWINVIPSVANVDRLTASNYTNTSYRYLLNATKYRFNNFLTQSSLTQEESKMVWVRDYLRSKNRGVDATWSIILAYGLVYGGYNEDEIKHEIQFGPGCLHAYIPRAIWSSTANYASCMAQALP